MLNGSVTSIQTETFSCQYYYCNEAAYNFINYNTFFDNCNLINCLPICSNYTCGDKSSQEDINFYYACQKTKCGSWLPNPPSSVQTCFVLAITAACSMGLAVLIGIIYGIVSAFCSDGISTLERISLGLTFVWPRFKYFAFRKRENWNNFYFDFKCMLIIDMIINVLYALTCAIYIYLATESFWQSGPEIACFYLILYSTISRGSMISEVSGPFFVANKELRMYR